MYSRDLARHAFLERLAKLTMKPPLADQTGRQKHECGVSEHASFLPGFEFSELMQPGQGSFNYPAMTAQATAVGRATTG